MVQSVIENGYKIPFTTHPPPFAAANNRSSREHPDFVEKAIGELLKNGCIQAVDVEPYCCNPLTVAGNNEKLRLVLDLRHVNKYVDMKHFKHEDLHTFADMFEEGDFFFIFDLKSGYHHISIHADFIKFLGFKWTFKNGRTICYVFVVLPFGLNIASHIFTKVVRPLVEKWRGAGIKAIVYIDDGINGKKTYAEAVRASRTVNCDLKNAGFIVNDEKTTWEPSQRGKWLGMNIDTTTMTFTVPLQKVQKLKEKIKTCLITKRVNAKQLASIAGTLSAMHMAVGTIVRLRTRAMYADIANTDSWYSPVNMSNETMDELKFWFQNYNFDVGYSIKPMPVTTKILFTYASDEGYGGFLVKRMGKTIVAGKFSTEESSTSSTMRELLAVKYSLQSLTSQLENESVRIYVDNFAASRILTVGSAKFHLQDIAITIFKICLTHNIKLLTSWVPRELNIIADHYSKIRDTDDWSIDNGTFNKISERFGRFTIDRFADNLNTKTTRFNSKFFCPGSIGVDAFTENWVDENNWVCPPVNLIGAVFKHMKRCGAYGTIFVPVWRSAYFWPLLYPDGLRLAHFVKDYMVVSPHYTSNGSNKVFVGIPQFKALALCCDFKR